MAPKKQKYTFKLCSNMSTVCYYWIAESLNSCEKLWPVNSSLQTHLSVFSEIKLVLLCWQSIDSLAPPCCKNSALPTDSSLETSPGSRPLPSPPTLVRSKKPAVCLLGKGEYPLRSSQTGCARVWSFAPIGSL